MPFLLIPGVFVIFASLVREKEKSRVLFWFVHKQWLWLPMDGHSAADK